MTPPKCDKCGDADNVYVKIIFYWDTDQKAWVNESFYNEVHCGACGNEAVDLPDLYTNAKVIT